MAGFRAVDENGHRAGAGEGGRQLFTDMGALADAQENQFALAAEDCLRHRLMLRPDHLGKLLNGVVFRADRRFDLVQ